MTNAEALQSVVDLSYQIDNLGLQKALLDYGLTDTDAYTSANKRSIDLAGGDIIFGLISSSDMNEGQFSLKRADRNALINKYNAIRAMYHLPSAFTPVIKRSSAW